MDRNDSEDIASSDTMAASADEVAATVTSHTSPRKRDGELDAPELRIVDRADYTVFDEVARGGMGRVMQATDRRHQRTVALKEMLSDSKDLAVRFEREALITARLQHPAIVPVYEAGRWPDGAPFYAMKMVEGRPLGGLIAACTSLDERMALLPNILSVCEALAYAHSRGIIHRDLKPSNVLVGAFGETVVIDWGLAKHVGDTADGEGEGEGEVAAGSQDDSLTVLGSVVGTPAYMPPEQADGLEADTRSDVYSLGAILYRLLAGVAPYQGSSAAEVLADVAEGPPTPLGERASGIPADLLAIVDKAMARNRADRYPSAEELAEELRRYQTGQLVGAHRYTAGELVWRWVRKHSAAVGVAAVLLVALAAVGAYSVQRIRAERDVANRERKAAVEARQRVENDRAAAEQLVDFVLADVIDELIPTARAEMLQGIAAQLVSYYERLDVDSDDADAQLRAMRALVRSSEALLPMGDIGGARSALDRGISIGEGLRDRGVADARVERELAALYQVRARVSFDAGDMKESRAMYERSVEVFERLHASSPTPDKKVDLSSALVELGAVMLVTRDLDEAEAVYQRTRVLSAELLAIDPTSKAYLRSWAETETRAGDVMIQRGKLDEAYTAYKAVYDKAVEYVALMPEDNEVHFGAGHAAMKLALVMRGKEQWQEAIGFYDYAIERYGTIHRRDPTVDRTTVFLAVMHNARADVRDAMGDAAAAIADNTHAIELLEPIVERNPEYAEWSIYLLDMYVVQAGMLARDPNARPHARQLAVQAVAIAERMERANLIPALYADAPEHARKALADIDAME